MTNATTDYVLVNKAEPAEGVLTQPSKRYLYACAFIAIISVVALSISFIWIYTAVENDWDPGKVLLLALFSILMACTTLHCISAIARDIRDNAQTQRYVG